MAWTSKQSATLTIERREEPYLTPTLLEKITNEIMPRYVTSRGALMTTLHEVQHEYGYIPWQAMTEIAVVLDISPAQVADVVSFYEDYHSEPMGKYVFWNLPISCVRSLWSSSDYRSLKTNTWYRCS